MRIFCFPFAGGSASVFRDWPAELPAEVELCAALLPGREDRWWEPPFQQITPLVQALAQALTAYQDLPFAFFGHSMGALIAFELTRQLRRLRLYGPAHLFVSGARAPHRPDVLRACRRAAHIRHRSRCDV